VKPRTTRLLIALAAAACSPRAIEQDTTTSTAMSSTGPIDATSTTSAAVPTSEDSGPVTNATMPPTDDTTSAADTDSTSGPGIIFDVGTTPDAPGVDPDCQQNLDIVFVMDVSTTMGGFIQILSDEILAVDAAVQKLDLLSEPHYGLAVFVDDAALLNEGNPYDDALALQADFDTWAAFTASNQQVGGGNSNGTWTENSLDGLYFAANGFQWRPEATTTRIIVHTTDDTFWDGPTIGNGVAIEHGYAETVTMLQGESVRVFSFAADIGGACGCDDVTMGWSTDYMGMSSIPVATDGGVFDIEQILLGQVSLADAIDSAVENSYCQPYVPG
jgi:hypothetical protein